jgi:cytochrome c oxidase cbb3-type subunit III
MKKYLSLMLLVSTLILFILDISVEGQNQPSGGPQSKGGKAGFLLPETHTSLTFVEQKGKALFDYYCAICHGATGNGDGFNSFNLTTPTAKLADPSLMAKLSDAQMIAVIKKGGAALNLSIQMPSWGDLFKPSEITTLIAYLHTLSKTGGTGRK